MMTITHRSGSPFARILPRLGGSGHWRARLVVAVLGVVAAPVVGHAAIVGFGDFSQFTINKNDAGAVPTFPAPGTIDLVNGANEARSVFAKTRQGDSQFTASFIYQVINSGSSAGAAFVLQNDPRGDSAVGTGNHALSGVQSSVEVTFDIGNNNTGLFTNGNATGAGTNASPVTFASGDPINVRFTYSGSTLTENLFDTVTSASFTTAFTVSIPTVVGGSSAFVGVSAGSSSSSVDQQFSNFQFSSTVPEPVTATLLLVTAGTLLPLRRARPATPRR